METSKILSISFSYIEASITAGNSQQEGGVDSKSNRAFKSSSRFYKTRQRIYGGLLLFVVIVGLPIVTVHSLRHRLTARVQQLKTALAGVQSPLTVQVGANRGPLPEEYRRPEPVIPQIAQLPPPPKVHTTPQGGYVPTRGLTRLTVKEPAKDTVASSAEDAETKDQTGSAGESEADAQPKYQQGKVEQDAYNLLLQTNAVVAGLVKGSNPSLKFKSWDAAARGDDVYWVRLTFQPEGKPVEEFIWQVKVQSKQVTPLSYNARAIS
jgi:hypothetical protein